MIDLKTQILGLSEEFNIRPEIKWMLPMLTDETIIEMIKKIYDETKECTLEDINKMYSTQLSKKDLIKLKLRALDILESLEREDSDGDDH